jgi:hypothetical protein
VTDPVDVERDPLAEVLEGALTAPDAVAPASAGHVASALRAAADDPSNAGLALGAFAALLYARPDLVQDTLLDALADFLRVESLPDDVSRHATRLWETTAATVAAPGAWTRLTDVLRNERVGPAARARLVPVVNAFAQWREDLVDLDTVLALAASPALTSHRAELLDQAVERLVFCAPERFTLDRLKALAELFQHLPRFRYVLYALAGRPGVPAEARAEIERQLAGRFAHHEAAAAILTGRPVRVLVVQNLGMGQGDELVRVVPLVQALLDANPALTVAILARRVFLYDNPRVTTVAISDDAAVQAVLREPFDAVIELHQPGWRTFTFRADLHEALEQMLATHPAALLIQGDLGRASDGRPGKRSQFLHQRVELDGRDIAGPCGLDQPAISSSYDPGHRLLAELGLPIRAAEERPRSLSLLTGADSADAERLWAELLPPGDGPVALVSPFGGSLPNKGFLDQDALLAAELEGLVLEGYRVVVLPQDADWARPAVIDSALARLASDVRGRVRVAPDPAEADGATRLALAEGPDLTPADRVMRLFKYFAGYAGLVVTVEGWLAHLAYLLGRPLRLFLAAGSFTPDWYPHGRGPAQRLVPALSPHALSAHARSALLGPTDPPPLPHWLRKRLLEIAVAGLERSCPEGVTLLRRAFTSPDANIRAGVAAALGRGAPAAQKADLLAALKDRSPIVVREAADALLRGAVDCSRELGTRYASLLQAYADGTREQWEIVAQLGPHALPVLFHLAKCDLHDVAWGATLVLREMLPTWVPPLRETTLGLDWETGGPGST